MAVSKQGSALPLVSCIMPTHERRAFVPRAVRLFQAQDYPNRELVILDDGVNAVADLIPPTPRIRYYHLTTRHSVGEKRNLACSLARGRIIVHWDDDDWHAPWRLSYQVSSLLEGGQHMCGLDRLYFYEPQKARAWCYQYPDPGRWLAGGTLCYRREHWLRHPFEDRDIGEDSIWVRHPAVRLALPRHDFYVAMIHPGNTSPKVKSGPWWHVVPESEILEVLGGEAARPRPAGKRRRLVSSREMPVRLTRGLSMDQPLDPAAGEAMLGRGNSPHGLDRV